MNLETLRSHSNMKFKNTCSNCLHLSYVLDICILHRLFNLGIMFYFIIFTLCLRLKSSHTVTTLLTLRSLFWCWNLVSFNKVWYLIYFLLFGVYLYDWSFFHFRSLIFALICCRKGFLQNLVFMNWILCMERIEILFVRF